MVAALVISAIMGVLLIALAISAAAIWMKIMLMILGIFLAVVAFGSIAFAIWGRYFGFPWHFTP